MTFLIIWRWEAMGSNSSRWLWLFAHVGVHSTGSWFNCWWPWPLRNIFIFSALCLLFVSFLILYSNPNFFFFSSLSHFPLLLTASVFLSSSQRGHHDHFLWKKIGWGWFVNHRLGWRSFLFSRIISVSSQVPFTVLGNGDFSESHFWKNIHQIRFCP